MLIKRLKRIAIAVAALLIVLMVAGFFVLRSRAFHHFVLAEIVTHANKATGGKVQIGDFAFDLWTLRVDLYRVAFFQTEPNLGHFSLWVRHLGVNLKIISLLGGKIGLRQVDIDRPVVDFVASATPRANLPGAPPGRESGGESTLFNLAIDRVTLDRGEIYLNDRRIPLEAKLLGLHAEIGFDALKKQYDGLLAYGDGHVQVSDYRPVAHSLDLRFSANADGIRANPLVIRAAESSVTMYAALSNYRDPAINGSYSVSLAAAEGARVLRSNVRPAGEIRTSGIFSYRSAPDRALFDSVTLSGIIGSPRLSVHIQQARGQVLALSGHYRLEHGNLAVNGVKAIVFGGRLTAEASIRDLAGRARGTLTASLQSLSIGALRSALPRNRWAKFPIEGSASASTQASWRGALKGLRASFDTTASAAVMVRRTGENAQPVPIHATIQGVREARAKALILRKSVLQTPTSEIDVSGMLGTRVALAVEARMRDLRQTDQLVTEFRDFANGSSVGVEPLGVSGSASFHGLVQGTLQHPKLTGAFSADHLRVEKAAFRHVQARVALSESELGLSQGFIQAAQGNASFRAQVGLQDWAYHASQPLSLELTANRMSLAALASVAHLRYPVSGTVSAQISMRGTASRPAGSGTIQVVRAEAWRQPIQDLMARFQGNGTAVESAIAVKARAGNIRANVTYDPETGGYRGQAAAQDVHLGMLPVFQAHQISGVATLSLRGQGTLKEPELQAQMSIPTLRLGQQKVTGMSAQVAVAHRVATLTLNSSFSGIPARANGTVDLTGHYQATLNFSTGTIEAGRLLSTYLPGGAANVQCETQVKGWLRGPLKKPQLLHGQVEIPTFRLGYQSVHIAAVSALTADYGNGYLIFKPAQIKGTGTDFHFQASLPVGSSGRLSASIDGLVNFNIVQALYPQWASSGQIQINVAAQGTRSHPQIQGQAHIVNAAFTPPNVPMGIQNINGTIAFNSTRAEITQLTAQSGGGSVAASGSVSYVHGMQFNLALKADGVHLAYPQGVDEVFTTQLTLVGTQNAGLLSGQVLIDNIFLSPQFDLTSFTSGFNIVSTPAGPSTGLMNHIKLNVAVRSSHQLSLQNDQLSISGAADLRVQGTLADPVIVGRTTLASGGSVLFEGKRFVVQNGTIDFVNPVMTEPVLNVSLRTTVSQYDVTLRFAGPVDRMRTTYTSSPPLAPADIVMLLISGHPTETPGTGLSAESVLAQGIGEVSSQVLKMAGLSSLTIDPQVGGYQTNPGVNIAMQKQVTKNLFFTFSVNTSTSADDVVQVQYQFSRHWSVEALRDEVGGYSLEIRSHKSF
jgi:translocation and assembly module TamB